MMRREWTNKIRFVLDELVPPIIRDSRWFMWPFFVLAYGRFSVTEFMDYKSRAYSMTPNEYANFYAELGGSVSRRRITDLNEGCVVHLVNSISKVKGGSILDVGSGNGYLLERVSGLQTWSRIVSVDVVPMKKQNSFIESHVGALPRLPFYDKEFDVVTCTHVLEHVLELAASARELMRVARRRILVVVPRQRYYYYTLDEHLNFFQEAEPLIHLFSPFPAVASLVDGDWVLEISLEQDNGSAQ